jgi:hypothetical protein
VTKYLLGVSLVAAMLLTGCGGGGGGLSVTGGSIPTGTITGHLALPSGQPLTSAIVTVTALPSTQVSDAVSTVSLDGSFSVTNLPTGKNIGLRFTQSGVTLKVVVPSSQVHGNGAANIGQVTALTTVVAQAIEKETKNADLVSVDLIVSGQLEHLLNEVKAQGSSQSQQELEISDSNELEKSATSAIGSAVNTELVALSATPQHHIADVALDGLVGQISSIGGTDVNIPAQQRVSLISAQLKPTTYTPAVIASALVAAGAPSATVAGVADADTAQRSQLPAWNSINPKITPYEAFAIAANPIGASGFALTPTQVSQFLKNLGIK